MRLFVFLAYALIALDATAGSRVIRDNRISDLGLPPSLGRGYSLSTNTYQSICMSKTVATTPSYNMRYLFEEVETNWEDKFRTRLDSQSQFQYLFLKSNVNFTVEQSGTDTYYYHSIFTHINLDSYYHALNEAESTLSPLATNLLSTGDTVGFFDACGPYYIRSLGRHSDFMGLLTYRTTSQTRDFNFELKVKNSIQGFFAGGSNSTTIDSDFQTETQNKRLRIVIWANGLGKDHLAEIIPTDLASFKTTVQQVIKTMQDASTGIVTTMEISPWVENLQFQSSLKLDSVNDILQYSQKKNLESNSELIAEINRIDRAQMDQYYKALNCRRILTEEYPTDGNFAFDPDRTWFEDLTARGQTGRQVKLSYLLSVLTQAAIDNYLQTNTTFLYGSGEPQPGTPQGAVGCVDELNKQGLKKVDFHTIAACNTARQTPIPISPVLDHYCLPEFARVDPPPPAILR
jgi:hypothetical protein